jgi:hypothetical protein
MPYASTQAEEIEVVDVDYDVSRFWSCSRAGTCPRTTWRYCLQVTPLTDEAAVKWYGIYHAEHLTRARSYVAGIARGDIRESPVPPVPTHTAEGRPLEPDEIEEEKEKHALLTSMERFRRDVQLYDRGDPEFRRAIIDQMKPGFRMQAYFSVAGSGSERRASGWSLTPDC